MKKLLLVAVSIFTLGFAAVALTETAPQSVTPKDGELPFPADYKSWPKFLSEVQRPAIKQIRELYLNPKGATASAGKEFPYGTVFVMENYKAREKADGTLEFKADGKLAKSDLATIFVMAKGEGWDKDMPDNLKTGSWVYSAYASDGKPLAEDFTKCRGCHIPMAQKDFVHRYDEYFEQRVHDHH
ncbi:MAG TPA: cytochrome P460 family protein [Nitrospiria bacterium]|nr:cytochrome P460 family protein [Nitrospiria bacterium]